jgi:hypothetical protein
MSIKVLESISNKLINQFLVWLINVCRVVFNDARRMVFNDALNDVRRTVFNDALKIDD